MFRFGLGCGAVFVAGAFFLVGCSGDAASVELGAQPLTRVAPEARGKNCPAGGLAIQSGVDANGSNVLEADEVKETSYSCNGEAKKIEPVISQIPVGDPRCAYGGTLLQLEAEKEI